MGNRANAGGPAPEWASGAAELASLGASNPVNVNGLSLPFIQDLYIL